MIPCNAALDRDSPFCRRGCHTAALSRCRVSRSLQAGPGGKPGTLVAGPTPTVRRPDSFPPLSRRCAFEHPKHGRPPHRRFEAPDGISARSLSRRPGSAGSDGRRLAGSIGRRRGDVGGYGLPSTGRGERWKGSLESGPIVQARVGFQAGPWNEPPLSQLTKRLPRRKDSGFSPRRSDAVRAGGPPPRARGNRRTFAPTAVGEIR